MNEKKDVFTFVEKLLNKTKKDKIFIVLLIGVLLLVIAMPTGNKSSGKDTFEYSLNNDLFTNESDSMDYESSLEEKIKEALGHIKGVGNVDVVVKTSEGQKVSGIMIICEGGDNKNLVSTITDGISGLLDVPVHKIKVMKMS